MYSSFTFFILQKSILLLRHPTLPSASLLVLTNKEVNFVVPTSMHCVCHNPRSVVRVTFRDVNIHLVTILVLLQQVATNSHITQFSAIQFVEINFLSACSGQWIAITLFSYSIVTRNRYFINWFSAC